VSKSDLNVFSGISAYMSAAVSNSIAFLSASSIRFPLRLFTMSKGPRSLCNSRASRITLAAALNLAEELAPNVLLFISVKIWLGVIEKV
jgi:hypothetical protein